MTRRFGDRKNQVPQEKESIKLEIQPYSSLFTQIMMLKWALQLIEMLSVASLFHLV